MERDQLKGILENVLFVADSPMGMDRLIALFEGDLEKDKILDALSELEKDYQSRNLALIKVADGWRIQTRPEFAPWITNFFKIVRGQKLSRASLEALAITAYRQPITRAEVEEIRGVDSGGVMRGLMEKNMVKTMGRRKSPGRPMLYGTTKRFLEYFGLSHLTDLPTMEEFAQEPDSTALSENIQESLDLDAPGADNADADDEQETEASRAASPALENEPVGEDEPDE